MSNSEKENTDAGWLGYFLALAVGAFVLCVFYLYGVSRFFCDWTQRGLFGDSFGALNSFFSGLALAGVIITIYLQSRELRLQRKEMRGIARRPSRAGQEDGEQFSDPGAGGVDHVVRRKERRTRTRGQTRVCRGRRQEAIPELPCCSCRMRPSSNKVAWRVGHYYPFFARR